jgi:hypothetical protein
MKAIEIRTKTEMDGSIRISHSGLKGGVVVRILILSEEDENLEEKNYLETISSNPAFDFLNDPAENIYSTKDGRPFQTLPLY